MLEQTINVLVGLGNVVTYAIDSALSLVIFCLTIAVVYILGGWFVKALRALMNGKR